MMIHEILKESWVYQEARQEGEHIGIQKGEQKALQAGKVEAMVFFIEVRFPALLPQAREVFACETTLEQIQAIQHKLYQANTLEEATAALQEYGNS